MSSTPRRTQPNRRKSTGGETSIPSTPTRKYVPSPQKKAAASTSKKRKRPTQITSPTRAATPARSKGLIFDPSTGRFQAATPQAQRAIRRTQREKIREIYLTAEFYKSQSRRTPVKRRKIDDERYVDGEGDFHGDDDDDIHDPPPHDDEFEPHRDEPEDHHLEEPQANGGHARTQRKGDGRENGAEQSDDERPPARTTRRGSSARRSLILNPPEDDDGAHDDDQDEEQDAVPPPRRRATVQNRASASRAPILDEEVAPDWRSIGQRAASKIDSEPGAVAILVWDANGRMTTKKVNNIPAMSSLSASNHALAMISKQDHKLYYVTSEALESPDAPQPFGPFVALSCIMVELQEDRLGAVFDDGRAAICLLENNRVKYFHIPDDRITKIELFGGAAALLTASGAVYVAGWPQMVLGLNNPEYNVSNDLERQEWTPRRLESLQEIVSISFSDRHALALNRRGECFAFGINGEGQLGLGEDAGAFVDTPTKIPSLRAIVHISTGMFQSAFLDATGQLYTCGSGKHMTTAQGHQDTIYVPTKVQHIEGKTPQEIIVSTGFCGFQFSVVTAWGRVFTCGFDALSFAPGRDNDKWNATLHLLRGCAHLSTSHVSGKLPFMALLLSESYTHVIPDDDDDDNE